MTMDLSFFRSETSNALRAEGGVEERAKCIVRLFDRRGIDLPDDVRARILACRDGDRLDYWFDRAITAITADELFTDQPSAPVSAGAEG